MNALKQNTLVFTSFGLLVCMAAHVGFAQIVQLPSFHNFSVSTSAWVPDSGTTSLGGVGYASNGSNSNGFGPYSPRATGGSVGGAAFSVSAQIIDLQAMDEAILSTNSPSSSVSVPSSKRNPIGMPPPSSRSNVVVATPGAWQRVLAGGGTPQELGQDSAETNVRYFLEKARTAENANRIESSRVYYRMAVQAMTPQLIARYQRVLAERAAAEEAQEAADAQASNKKF